MRICLVYDCLFPWTVGGAERWYRNLAERLVADGHDVTYLTRRQWAPGEEPESRACGSSRSPGATQLYDATAAARSGRRCASALGVLRHLARHRRALRRRPHLRRSRSSRCSRPRGAAPARRLRAGRRLVRGLDEGLLAGVPRRVGGASAAPCSAPASGCRQRAFCFSACTRGACASEGLRGEVDRLRGLCAGDAERRSRRPAEPLVVFAGRHIPEKRAPALLRRDRVARERRPGCARRSSATARSARGSGPRSRARARRRRRGAGLRRRRGRRRGAGARRPASCCRRAREGYGLVVVEAAARGTPSVVVAAPDNAAPSWSPTA